MTADRQSADALRALSQRVAVLEARLTEEVETRQRERRETLDLFKELAEAARGELLDLKRRGSTTTIPSGA